MPIIYSFPPLAYVLCYHNRGIKDDKIMANKNQQTNATPESNNRYAYEPGNFQAVVYDDFNGQPLKVTFLDDRWWVTTAGEKLQPLTLYFEGDDTDIKFLCEAGGTVGALALAKMLGKAAEEPEDKLDIVLRNRMECLKRLGVTLDPKDEQLTLELLVFSNEKSRGRRGKFSMWCHVHDDFCEMLFDIDLFDTKQDAEEWARCYFDFLEKIGIDFTIV